MILLLVTGLLTREDNQNTQSDEGAIPDSNPLFSKADSGMTIEEELMERAGDAGELDIAVTGSSVSEGQGASAYEFTWPALLEKELNASGDLSNVEVHNYGVSGFKVADLLQENVVADVIDLEPEVIIFETSVINSYFHEEPFDVTKQSIEEVVSMVEQDLPDTLVIWVSPNPISESTFSSVLNNKEYETYVEQSREFIIESGWNYFDSYSAWVNELDGREESTDDFLIDGVHPNDEGYRLWFELMNEHVLKA
ncbi:SGNH/GDSL hydrolase family protein [Alkalicoccobacillus porphyridii]|nr:SGNH/GDSL hydrolase family protein [Alkalicoccobacillus porphyridii]